MQSAKEYAPPFRFVAGIDAVQTSKAKGTASFISL